MQTPLPGFKRCRKCGEVKSLSEYYEQPDMQDGHRHNCKTCHAQSHRQWYEQNRDYEIDRVRRWQRSNPEKVNASHRRRRAIDPETVRRKNREGHLRRKYGISQNMFEALVLAQLGKCAICQASEGMELHVDHDHRSNKVRGLLCGKCNKAIGLLNDDVQLMDAAQRYLEQANRFWKAPTSRSAEQR